MSDLITMAFVNKVFQQLVIGMFSFLAMTIGASAQFPEINYPEPMPAGKNPVVFAKGLVSSEEHEFGCCFSPDGKEFYFTRAVGKFRKKSILVMRFDGNTWSLPEKALPGFQGETYEPHITADGTKLYFMGMSQLEKDGETKMLMDLYYAEKENGQWSEITHLGEPFNPMKSMYVSTASNNVLYTTNRSGEGPDIVYVKIEDGQYSHYLDPGPSINTSDPELYPFIAADGSYLLFNRITGKGKLLFVCFMQKNGEWGEEIEVPLGMESGCPMVSPDGKFLFFNSGKKFLNDIYWVPSEVFLELGCF